MVGWPSPHYKELIHPGSYAGSAGAGASWLWFACDERVATSSGRWDSQVRIHGVKTIGRCIWLDVYVVSYKKQWSFRIDDIHIDTHSTERVDEWHLFAYKTRRWHFGFEMPGLGWSASCLRPICNHSWALRLENSVMVLRSVSVSSLWWFGPSGRLFQVNTVDGRTLALWGQNPLYSQAKIEMIHLEVFLLVQLLILLSSGTAHASMGRQCLPAHDFMNLVRTALGRYFVCS